MKPRCEQTAQRAARRARSNVGIRGVASDSDGRELGGDRDPREGHGDCEPRDVADAGQREQVPRGVEAEPIPAGEREHEERWSQKTAGEKRESRRRRPGLGQPEPGIESRQQEDEGERIRRDDDEREQGEREQRGRVARKRLLSERRSFGEQPLAADEPAPEEEHREHCQAGRRRIENRFDMGRKRSRLGVREESELCADEEEEPSVGPEPKSALKTARRRPERHSAPATTCEQIDRRDQEREQGGKERQLDRPAANEPAAEVDVARRALGKLDSRIERAEQVLGRAADLPEALDVQGLVFEGCRRALVARRQRDRGDPSSDQRPLLAEREGKAEIEELSERTRAARLVAGFLQDPRRCGPDEHRRGRAGLVAGEYESWEAVPCDRVEADDRDCVGAIARDGREPLGSEGTVRPAVGGDEDERVGRRRLEARRPGDRGKGSRELDQGGRPGGIVVRAAILAGVVAVSHEDDRAGRRAWDDCDEIPELDAAASRNAGGEPVRGRAESYEPKLIREPLCGPERAGRAGRAVRKIARQLARQLGGGRRVECRG